MTGAADWASRHLGYQFADERLLRQALTHRSAGRRNNERLEFLGDAVLGMVIALALFEQESRAPEGTLSRYRAGLVRKESLAALARTLALGEQLQMGSGEHRTGGHHRDAALADALEAVFGAILLDGGFPAAEQVIRRLFAESLAALPAEEELVDAKTALQEHLQALGLSPPDYQLLETTGAPHERTFHALCQLPHFELETRGTGSSRRQAEQMAASRALERLRNDD